MIIVYLNDGLGNQMFQFALYRKLESLGKDVYIYDIDLRKRNALHNGLELEKIWNLQYPRISYREFRHYDTKNLFPHIIRKLFYEKTHPIFEEESMVFKPDIFSMDNICLKGYWQCEKYFKDIESQIRNDYSFPLITDTQNKKWSAHINDVVSVGVHVRRGDYVSKKYQDSFGCICNENYYLNAIRYMQERIKNIHLFIFSNDISWCKSFFKEPNISFIEGNEKDKSYIDMQLMSQCKHQIIANSSFSWWAAWLNNNPNKIVIAPSKWINGRNEKDVVCEDWVKI